MGVQEKILAYLSVYGKENKYRIASALKIDEEEVIKALIDLEKEGKVEMKGGRAILVKGTKPIIKKERKQKTKPTIEQPPAEEEIEQPKEEVPAEIKPKEKPKEEQPQTEVSEETTGGETEEEPTEEEVRETFRVKKEGDERVEGTVKFFNPNKGFGFITEDDGKEYYVHKSALKEGVTIEADDRVSFKPVEGDKGPKAEEVELVSQA